ncbi:MAG: HmuY family protein [Balneolaceae bacterium]
MHTNIYTYLSLISISLFITVACSDSTTGNEEEPPGSEIEANQVEDLHAPADRTDPNPSYVLFSLRTGDVVASDDSASANWDIGFSGSSMIVNSGVSGPGAAGAILLDVPFDQIELAPSSGYGADTNEEMAIQGLDGWYIYTGTEGSPAHAILAKEDVTILIKTADENHYAKVQIQSYYQGNPETDTAEFANLATRPASQYYTFRYAIQMTEGLRELN